MQIGIYKITNLITGKVYIGQSRDIKARWEKHKSVYKNQENHRYKLYRAMNKYGLQNFLFEVIQECKIDQLNEKEQYWIQFYDSYNNGYNMTLGGDGFVGANDKIVLQYNSHGKFLREFSSAHEAERETNILFTNICRVCRGERPHAGGFIWRYKNNPLPVKDLGNILVRGKRILQYDLNMNFIQSYPSRTKAAEAIGISKTAIGNACSGKQKTAGGFLWKVEE